MVTTVGVDLRVTEWEHQRRRWVFAFGVTEVKSLTAT